MLERTALWSLFAIMLAAGFSLGWPATPSHAQEPGARTARPAPRDAVLGHYSMTLSDIWGLPEMPPAPKDFGPHFDFPPQSLMDNGGGLTQDPYFH
jgi:hypothetical protein